MRISPIVALVVGLPFVIACSGDPPDTPKAVSSNAVTTTAPAPAPSAPAAPSTPAPADTTAQVADTPEPTPTLVHVENDIDDPAADSTCAALALAEKPLGTFTADPSLALDGANDVRAFTDPSDDTSIGLMFYWPAKLTSQDGQPWRDDVWRHLAITVPSVKALAAGSTLANVVLGDFQPMDDSCTNQELDYSDMPGGGCGVIVSTEISQTSTLTITAISATEIEGTVDIVQDGGASGDITFKAPLNPAAIPSTNGICCLKQR